MTTTADRPTDQQRHGKGTQHIHMYIVHYYWDGRWVFQFWIVLDKALTGCKKNMSKLNIKWKKNRKEMDWNKKNCIEYARTGQRLITEQKRIEWIRMRFVLFWVIQTHQKQSHNFTNQEIGIFGRINFYSIGLFANSRRFWIFSSHRIPKIFDYNSEGQIYANHRHRNLGSRLKTFSTCMKTPHMQL